MACENETNSKNCNDFIFEKLHNAFYSLLNDLKKLNLKNKKLRKLNHSLLEEKIFIQKKRKGFERIKCFT